MLKPGKADDMISGNQARNPATPSIVVGFEQRRQPEAASHDRALATREAELREALAKVQALRR
jgi:hypothetical protein